MRKPNDDPKHIKNKMLICIFVFRSLPLQYIEKISSSSSEFKERVRHIIVNLIEDKIITKTAADNGMFYLRLTGKGYEYSAHRLLPQEKNPFYTFRRDRSLRNPITDHNYYNFVFVWDWTSKNTSLLSRNIQIYDDSNLNHSRVIFPYNGRNVVISPDVLIFLPDTQNNSFKRAIFVENDAGGETYHRIYTKIIEYAVMVNAGLDHNSISGSELYFVFNTEIRAKQMLLGKQNILRFFDFNNSSAKTKNISIDVILRSFQKMPLYYAFYNKKNLINPLQFEKYDLTGLLLERHKEWEIYL